MTQGKVERVGSVETGLRAVGTPLEREQFALCFEMLGVQLVLTTVVSGANVYHSRTDDFSKT